MAGPYPDAMLTKDDWAEIAAQKERNDRRKLRQLALDHKVQFPKHARLIIGANFVECFECGYHVHLDAGREIEHN